MVLSLDFNRQRFMSLVNLQDPGLTFHNPNDQNQTWRKKNRLILLKIYHFKKQTTWQCLPTVRLLPIFLRCLQDASLACDFAGLSASTQAFQHSAFHITSTHPHQVAVWGSGNGVGCIDEFGPGQYRDGWLASSQNCRFARRIWTPSNTWFLGPNRVDNPNGILIASAVFAGLTTVTDRQTTLHSL